VRIHLLAAVAIGVVDESELPVGLLHVADGRIGFDLERVIKVELELCWRGGGGSGESWSLHGGSTRGGSHAPSMADLQRELLCFAFSDHERRRGGQGEGYRQKLRGTHLQLFSFFV